MEKMKLPLTAIRKTAREAGIEEPRWGIWKEVIFRCLEGGMFGICPLAFKMVLFRTMFMTDPQRLQDSRKREKKADANTIPDSLLQAFCPCPQGRF